MPFPGREKALLLWLILLLAGILALHASQAAVTNNSLTVGNDDPTVNSIVINNGSPITLTPNTTTAVHVNATVTDNNGCGDVFFGGNKVTFLYRSSTESSCGLVGTQVVATSSNYLFCYLETSITHNCPSATSTQVSANTTTTFSIWYFAQATDASSSFPSDGWNARLWVQDATNLGFGWYGRESDPVDLNTLLAIDATPTSTSYGSLPPGENTGSTNRGDSIRNVGNASTTLQISGTALSAGGSNAMATSSQHYATTTFTFGGAEQVLSAVASAVAGLFIPEYPIGSITSTTALPNRPDVFPMVHNNGYLYTLGGATTTVYKTAINGDRSVGSWESTVNLPTAMLLAGGASNNGYIYRIGGDIGSSVTTSVQFASTTATGTILGWTNTSALPSPRARAGTAIYNNFLYTVGGTNLTTPSATSTVFFTSFNSTGSLAAWTATTPLPEPLSNTSAFAHNGYLYMVGGYQPTLNTATSVVWFAPINSTGSIGSWATTTPLPYRPQFINLAVDNDIVYTIGGSISGGGGVTSSILFAPILGNGHLNGWSYSPKALPSGSYAAGTQAVNGMLYLVGGYDASAVLTSTVRMVELPSDPVYWGLEIPGGTTPGSYSGTITYTGIFSP